MQSNQENLTNHDEPCAQETRILKLYRRWKCFVDVVGSNELDLKVYLLDALSDEICALEVQIMREPVTCVADFAVKMITDTARGGLCLDWDTAPIWIEARALISAKIGHL